MDKFEKFKELFPEFISDEKIDIDVLKQIFGEHLKPEPEKFEFTWVGKKESLKSAETTTDAILEPCPEESVDWDTTQNIFIEGDNLDALKILQKEYLGKVKMIYIDPPYNTGNKFVYKDKFQDSVKEYKKKRGITLGKGQNLSNNEVSDRRHSNWLNMMFPRLHLAKNLLKDDGVIFISIDDNEVSNLRKMCDEIFGEENFVDQMIWKKRYGGGAKEKYLVSLHEYIVIYCKSIESFSEIFVPLTKDSIERYYKLKDSNYEKRGPYRTHPLEAGKAVDERPNLIFDIKAPDGTIIKPKRQWYWNKERVEEAISNNELEFIRNAQGEWSVHSKQYLKNEDGSIRQGKAFSIIDDVYSQHGTNETIELFGNAKIFSYPKPSILLSKLLQIGLEKDNELVLDFFSGSSSTAHAIFRLNVEDDGKRKFIMVQLPEATDEKSEAYKSGFKTIAEISKERIRRAAAKIKEENPDYNGDLGFKVFKIKI